MITAMVVSNTNQKQKKMTYIHMHNKFNMMIFCLKSSNQILEKMGNALLQHPVSLQRLTKLRNNCHCYRPGHCQDRSLFMMARNSSVEERIFFCGESSSSNDVTKLRQQQKRATTKNASEAQNRFSDIKD